MARVYKNRQMGKLLQEGNGTQVQGISPRGFKSPNPPFTGNDLAIPLRRDVLCREEKLLNRGAQTTLEQHWVIDLSHLGQELAVLHVSGTNLEDIRIPANQIDIHRVQYFRDYGQPCDIAGRGKITQALKAVG
jgi:hypothetical protein